MRRCAYGIGVTVFLLIGTFVAAAQVAEYTFTSTDGWEALPDWNLIPAISFYAETGLSDGETFVTFVNEDPGTTMKWKFELPNIDPAKTPVFSVRYKIDAVAADAEYILWFAGTGSERIFLRPNVFTRGEWDVLTVNLLNFMNQPEPLFRMVVQVAAADRPASVSLAWMSFTESE